MFTSKSRVIWFAAAMAVAFLTCSSSSTQADPPKFLQKLMGRDVSKELKNVRYELNKVDGPWMILATTFVGENAKARAERTAKEIRAQLRMPAFIYRERFDFTGKTATAGTTRQTRFANPYEYEAYALLVGEYDTINHPNVERDMRALKKFQPSAFVNPNDIKQEFNTSTPATTIKAFSHKLFASRKGHGKSAMANAFVTRNPLLPKEFFSPPTVDSFVSQLNEGKPHSLLKCDGKFTVVVCTFEGLQTIVNNKDEKRFTPSMKRLDQFAIDASKALKQLRKDGEEAYQYHDRHRSLVTVGSFDTLGRELPGGGFEYAPEIRRVMQKYSALNSRIARTVPGQAGIAVNHAAMIPFDIQPMPIAVPKTSKRSLYTPKFGMR